MSNQWRVRIHPDLSAVERTWRTAEAKGSISPFQRLDWIRTLIDSVGRSWGREAFVLEVFDQAGASLMLLPLIRESSLGIRTITIIDFGVCDYLAPVLLPGATFEPEMARELWRVIQAALPKADLIAIPKMPPFIAARPNPLVGLRNVRVMAMRRYGLPIAPPAENLIQRVTRSSTYRDLAKFKRRLHRRGKVAFTVGVEPTEVVVIANVMFAQRRERFRGMGRQNLMDRPEIERFYRDAALNGLVGGPARIFGLSVDGEWVATGYGLLYGQTFALVAQTMVEGSWRNCSPGILICAEIMEWAAAEGVTYFDFTTGFLPYKLEFGASEGCLYELAEAFTLRGTLVLRTTRALRGVRATVRHHPILYNALRSTRSAWLRIRPPRAR